MVAHLHAYSEQVRTQGIRNPDVWQWNNANDFPHVLHIVQPTDRWDLFFAPFVFIKFAQTKILEVKLLLQCKQKRFLAERYQTTFYCTCTVLGAQRMYFSLIIRISEVEKLVNKLGLLWTTFKCINLNFRIKPLSKLQCFTVRLIMLTITDGNYKRSLLYKRWHIKIFSSFAYRRRYFCPFPPNWRMFCVTAQFN